MSSIRGSIRELINNYRELYEYYDPEGDIAIHIEFELDAEEELEQLERDSKKLKAIRRDVETMARESDKWLELSSQSGKYSDFMYDTGYDHAVQYILGELREEW